MPEMNRAGITELNAGRLSLLRPEVPREGPLGYPLGNPPSSRSMRGVLSFDMEPVLGYKPTL